MMSVPEEKTLADTELNQRLPINFGIRQKIGQAFPLVIMLTKFNISFCHLKFKYLRDKKGSTEFSLVPCFEPPRFL